MKAYSAPGLARARQLRKSWTDAELHLWHLLRNRGLGKNKFRRQHPVGPYIVDFICLEQKLVIELDGSQHINRADQDKKRTAYLATQGYRVMRFWDNDVLMQTESVMQAIFDLLISPSP